MTYLRRVPGSAASRMLVRLSARLTIVVSAFTCRKDMSYIIITSPCRRRRPTTVCTLRGDEKCRFVPYLPRLRRPTTTHRHIIHNRSTLPHHRRHHHTKPSFHRGKVLLLSHCLRYCMNAINSSSSGTQRIITPAKGLNGTNLRLE